MIIIIIIGIVIFLLLGIFIIVPLCTMLLTLGTVIIYLACGGIKLLTMMISKLFHKKDVQ